VEAEGKSMTFESRNSNRPFLVTYNVGEPIAEQRARVALEHAEREEHRQADLVELSSTRNVPGDRIRLWERLHGLTLPRDPNHSVLDVIAAATDLELVQVQEEQRRRQPAKPLEPAELIAQY
jgi:hypothetical protein